MSELKKTFDKQNFFRNSVVGILLLRLLLNAIVPLMDKTEARYAEIARLMYETNNWITPQIDYGVPFWAKPPLNTWLSAMSMKVFGVNEFAVRFPAFLLSLFVVWLLGKLLEGKKERFFMMAFIMFTLPQFLLHAGVVSTDTSLLMSITLIMVAFWKQMNSPQKNIWGYLLFVGVGLGLLAKGPIVIILTAPPIFVWVLMFGEFKKLFTRLPWLLGLAILSLIAVPWYVLAEKHSEGFIDYFIVGEHFKRFFDASWRGDKYGFPKTQPLGIVWLFLFGMALPWVQLVVVKLWKERRAVLKNRWLVFLIGWLLWTPLFFSVSKSLIHTYVLPVMPPIALLVMNYWDNLKNKKTAIGVSLVLPCLALVILSLGLVNNNFSKYSNTDKYLIEQYWDKDIPLYYLGTKSYSSQFYSSGKVKSLSIDELKEKMKDQDAFQIIISDRTLRKQSDLDVAPLMVEGSSMKNKIYSYH